MALAETVFLAEKYRKSRVCLLMMFVLAMPDVGVTWNINNVSRVIEDLLETYDIRLRPRFGGKQHQGRFHVAAKCWPRLRVESTPEITN